MAQTKERGPGKYLPGYQTTTLQVPHRDVFVNLFIWYPTDDDRPTELTGQNALFYGHYVRPNAQPKSGTHPVVVFSHGSGGNALQVGWLAEALAEKGYVVLAANHPGTKSRDSLPEKTVMIWERANDLSAILNWAEIPTIEGLSLDTENISVTGFSLGGHSALAISGLQVSKANFIEYCDRNPDIWDCGGSRVGAWIFLKSTRIFMMRAISTVVLVPPFRLIQLWHLPQSSKVPRAFPTP